MNIIIFQIFLKTGVKVQIVLTLALIRLHLGQTKATDPAAR